MVPVTERKQSRRVAGPVEKATRANLKTLGVSEHSDALAAAAISLARGMDESRGMGKAALGAQHRLLMADLEKTAVRPEKDVIDDVNSEPARLRAVAG